VSNQPATDPSAQLPSARAGAAGRYLIRALRPLARPVAQVAEHWAENAAAPLRAELEVLRREVDALRRRADDAGVAEELLLGPAARLNDRRLSRQQVDDLVSQLRAVTGVDDPVPDIAVAYRLLVQLESGALGRIAGTTSNVVGKLVAGPALASRPGVLEIGTLFGVFACAITRQMERRGLAGGLTVVDPLDVVQVQPDRARASDPSGGRPTLETLHTNLALGGVPVGTTTVLQGLSTDPGVRQRADMAAHGMVVVDGDHSQAGVAADLGWVERDAAVGTVVVLDDYGDVGWPGVEAAVTAHLAGVSRLTLTGVVSTSAFAIVSD
jgi:hypothetical protein